ncbi:MAG: DnaJ-class molecular chaperone [Candidatus Curtissbacteria bacterium GW2011_GWA1_40_24]|uniref:DnaJ-class molecular chaperone n=1 Tax=Candidatus Curtissbacteria bacterium GW2011_GWA1_40_24 TaxID=1618406 RepID=A0A0G0RS55_9BACT|nr:MAG: DnaJ-class molecular chaperone [Candidatus Curtissbacteria bacterium GW2011_GWA1_40_24]
MVFGQRSPFGRQARLSRYVINITFDEAVHGTQKEVEIEGKRQKIKIPAGVDDGSEIRFSNYIIVCQVSRHPKFVRRGYDIVTEHEISYSRAALGSVEDIETIDGPVKIRIPSGTQPGTQIRLRAKGVPRVSGHGQGDHYVIIRVKVPSKLSRDQKRLLEELERT